MSFIPFISIWTFSLLAALLFNSILRRRMPNVTLGRIIAISFTLAVLLAVVYLVARIVHGHVRDIWLVMKFSFAAIFLVGPLAYLGILCISSLAFARSDSIFPIKKRISFAGIISGILMTLAFGLPTTGVYMNRIEPNWVETTRTTIQSSKLKRGTPPLTILQLSDLHIEQMGKREIKALSIVENIKPDIIVLTGDYVNLWSKAPLMNEFARKLKAPYGIYAVPGNWNWNPAMQYSKFFKGTHVQYISGKSVAVKTPSGDILISGVDYNAGKFGGFKVPKTNHFSILLSHTPDASLYIGNEVDLLLAGHTHGGQIRIPGLGPVVTFANIKRKSAAGLSRLNSGGYMYVNRGLGMEGGKAPRIRLFCRPEVTVITLKPQ
jgi:predicted MPP superfamily phosphohydrolase